MTRPRYKPLDFGAGDSPVSSDVLDALVYVQRTQDVHVSLHLQVKEKDGYDAWYEAVALALAGPTHPKGRLFEMIEDRWPNKRHRTLSAMLYRLVLDLEESVGRQVSEASQV